jgi:CrcB protein
MSGGRSLSYVNLLLIATGGALGSVARYLFSSLVYRLVPSLFPFGTLAVNVAGCVAFGLLVGAAQQRFVLAPGGRAFLLIGALGGFTTVSTFAFETFQLMRDGQFLWAAMNIVGQVVAGMVGLWVGFAIGAA